MKKRSIAFASVLLAASMGVALMPSLWAAKADSDIQPAFTVESPALEPAAPACSNQDSAQAIFESNIEEPAGACYPFQPSCVRDKDCDAYCGQKGWGVCSRWCCWCLG